MSVFRFMRFYPLYYDSDKRKKSQIRAALFHYFLTFFRKTRKYLFVRRAESVIFRELFFFCVPRYAIL